MELYRGTTVLIHKKVSDYAFIFHTYAIVDRRGNSRESRTPSEDHLASVSIMKRSESKKVDYKRVIMLTGTGDVFDFPNTRLTVSFTDLTKGKLSCTVGDIVHRPAPINQTLSSSNKIVPVFSTSLRISDFSEEYEWLGIKAATRDEVYAIRKQNREERESRLKLKDDSNAHQSSSTSKHSKDVDEKKKKSEKRSSRDEKIVLRAERPVSPAPIKIKSIRASKVQPKPRRAVSPDAQSVHDDDITSESELALFRKLAKKFDTSAQINSVKSYIDNPLDDEHVVIEDEDTDEGDDTNCEDVRTNLSDVMIGQSKEN